MYIYSNSQQVLIRSEITPRGSICRGRGREGRAGAIIDGRLFIAAQIGIHTCTQVSRIVRMFGGPRLDTANRSISELGHLSASNETSVWRKSWTIASTPAFATPGLRSLVITYPMDTNCYIVACPPFVTVSRYLIHSRAGARAPGADADADVDAARNPTVLASLLRMNDRTHASSFVISLWHSITAVHVPFSMGRDGSPHRVISYGHRFNSPPVGPRVGITVEGNCTLGKNLLQVKISTDTAGREVHKPAVSCLRASPRVQSLMVRILLAAEGVPPCTSALIKPDWIRRELSQNRTNRANSSGQIKQPRPFLFHNHPPTLHLSKHTTTKKNPLNHRKNKHPNKNI